MRIFEENKKVTDKYIVFFLLLFSATLTNSLFLNQIGYYFALIIIIIYSFRLNENQFHKVGVELAALFFILAEIISAILSDNHPAAFENVLKRFLLIPIIITLPAGLKTKQDSKYIFWGYMITSLIMALYYLILSTGYYIQGQYSIEASGPTVLHHPITMSELFSFLVIYCIAFFLNEKNWKIKIVYLIGIGLSFFSLISTFKRTGWIGLGFGVIVLLLMKKQYKILFGLAILFLLVLVSAENVSKLNIYDIKGNLTKQIETDGKVHQTSLVGNEILLPDFENGILRIENFSDNLRIETPSPVIEVLPVDSSKFIARLIDTRIILFIKNGSNFIPTDTVTLKGFTKDLFVKNNVLYTLASDSGFSIYKIGKTIELQNHINKIIGFNRFEITDNSVYLTDLVFRVDQFNLNENDLIFERSIKTDFDILTLIQIEGNVIISGSKKVLLLNNENTNRYELKNFENVTDYQENDNKIYLLKGEGRIKTLSKATGETISINNFDYMPYKFSVINNKFYISELKTNRLLSIIDKYEPSNIARLEMWKTGLLIFSDHPIFGVGDIGIEKYFMDYKEDHQKEVVGHLHNNYVHILVILGIFGFISFSFLLLRITKDLYVNYQITKGDNFYESVALGSFAGFVAFLISGITEWNFGDHEIIAMVWFMVGISYTVRIQKQKENQNP